MEAEAPSPVGGGHPTHEGTDDSRFAHALTALATKRAARTHQERAARLAEAERGLREAREELAGLESSQQGLERSYRQRVASVHEAAHVLWDRYVAGYGVGTSRGSSGGPDLPPELDLTIPRVLQGSATTTKGEPHGTA